MSNEITQDAVFRPQDLYQLGDAVPPIKNGALASSLDFLKADDQQVSLLFHSHAHYCIGSIASDSLTNQFGEKTTSYTDVPIAIYVPPFTNRAALVVSFSGEGVLTINYIRKQV